MEIEMSSATVKALLEAFDSSDWQEMTISIGQDRLHVSRRPTASAEEPATPAPAISELPAAAVPHPAPTPTLAQEPAVVAAAEAPAAAPGTPVLSPSVGIFWRAPAPGAPPFVEVGSRVTAGETVAIIEIMKLMSHLGAPADGLVTAVLVENGEAVEHGQPLVVIDSE
jgi:acetyl-CoA carboxylase biotin carboxyl carrier protein